LNALSEIDFDHDQKIGGVLFLSSPSKAKATKKTFTITEIVKENMDPNAKGKK